jgi:hypothetical protein
MPVVVGPLPGRRRCCSGGLYLCPFVVGLTHPSFAKVARELSTAGAAKLGLGVDAARPPLC